jgi:hypothetical protein
LKMLVKHWIILSVQCGLYMKAEITHYLLFQRPVWTQYGVHFYDDRQYSDVITVNLKNLF